MYVVIDMNGDHINVDKKTTKAKETSQGFNESMRKARPICFSSGLYRHVMNTLHWQWEMNVIRLSFSYVLNDRQLINIGNRKSDSDHLFCQKIFHCWMFNVKNANVKSTHQWDWQPIMCWLINLSFALGLHWPSIFLNGRLDFMCWAPRWTHEWWRDREWNRKWWSWANIYGVMKGS